MPDPKMGKTGNAEIVKQGQTKSSNYGADPDLKIGYRETKGDLNVK